ncbi:toxin YxiD [Cytobacillus horneckiae]|uniref:ribonuclease YeeF family protein n=1 Tax=Cytobacillus horneckiae TaxID=549687 RepID=UPI0019CFFBFF|nr:T7SS effector LXG polymorphic toxin [Cytobacillus horneckiae]MBN6889581.1 LXG domain-containing protein [Cytobacillus horneckiae]MCM3180948.1 LXG domain-containing protein [Cytobacillus horneckiae]
MKVLDKIDLENSIHQLTTAINLLKEQIHQVQLDIQHLVSLEDALKGQGGQAIRLFYQECHLPFLVFLVEWINDYESTLNKMSQSLQELEPSPSGFIRQSFLENELVQGLRRADTNTKELTSEANSIIQSVQDIVTLPLLDEGTFVRDTRLAQDTSVETLEKLREFDKRETTSLEPLQQGLQKMNQYIEQMRSMFKNGEFNLALYKPEVLTWQDSYDKLSNKNTDITTEQSTLHDIAEGVIEGSTNAVADVWEGLKSTFKLVGNIPMITNPRHLQNVIRFSRGENLLEHYRFINRIIQDPKASIQPVIDMPKYIWTGIKEAWERDVVNGDVKSRTAFFSYGLTSLGIGLLGDKGISKAGTIVKTVDKAAKGIENIPKPINTPTPALAGGMSQPPVPYNVINNPLTQVKTLTEDVFEVKGMGKAKTFGKYSTAIDDKVKVIEKVDLPDWISESFSDSKYRTVITEENITFYRTYGGGAKPSGSFVTTSPARNRINAKTSTALVPDWKNTRQYEAVIEVPKGQVLNIGRVEKQYTKTGALLEGDGDQILLPQGWPSEWIKETREVPSR